MALRLLLLLMAQLLSHRVVQIDCFVSSSKPFPRSTILFRQISNYPLRDGRRVRVHNSEFSDRLKLRVQRVARAAIRKKNSFSFCLTGGYIPIYLKGLPSNLPYHKWHIFLAEETLGTNNTYMDILNGFARECNIPLKNIHPVGVPTAACDAATVAMNYEKEIRLHPAVDNKGSGCPHVDLMLLEAGVKGRVARLLPDSKEVRDTGLSSQAVMAVQTENSITASIDFMRAARTTLICATGLKKSPMVEIALTRSFYKHECPAGMIYSNQNTIDWYVDLESTTDFRACVQRAREAEKKRIEEISMETQEDGA